MKRNVLAVFISSVAASGLSILTVPFYIHLIGPERYGVLAFVWLIIGYFGLFVLGLDRAITNQLARHRHDPNAARSLFQTAVALNIVASGLGAVILYFIGYLLLDRMVNADNALRGEILSAMPWIAAAVPVATTTSLFIGALEAYERFKTLASTQFSGTLLFQVVPVAVAWGIGPELKWVIPAAVLTRTATSLWMVVLLWPVMGLRAPIVLDRRWIPDLVRYGSSVGISGIVSPILTSLDRLLISAQLGAAAVSYYVVPSSLVSAVQILPGSLLRVMFPQLSIASAVKARTASVEATLGLAALLTPIIACAIPLAHLFMTLWIGAAFAEQSQGVPEIMLYGAWMNCLALVPYSLLHAQGRPGWVARVHVLELIPFVGLVWLGVHFGGLRGAALAGSLRLWVDAFLLFRASALLSPLWRSSIFPICAVTLALLVSLFVTQFSTLYVIVSATVVLLSCIWGFRYLPVGIRSWLPEKLKGYLPIFLRSR